MRKILILIAALYASPALAQSNGAATAALQQLHQTVAAACGNCIAGVSVGNPAEMSDVCSDPARPDGNCWGLFFVSGATGTQESEAEAALAAFNFTAAENAVTAAATGQVNLSAGLTISCASGATVCTSAIAGTYKLDPTSQSFIAAESIALLQNDAFTNGQTTKPWLDASGAAHTFTIPQWKEFATAAAAFVDGEVMAVATAQQGGTPSWPSASAALN